MIISTLCYIEKDNKYLMLHRTKKKRQNDRENLKKIGNSRGGNGMRNQGGIQ